MFGLDAHLEALMHDGGLPVVLVVAFLLGLRHATDPDHLTAVSTLVLSDDLHGARRASVLGFVWGAGHATTLFAFGLPIVLFEGFLPGPVQTAAEVAVGVMIVALAVRLLVRWRRGYLHAHPHTHGELRHAHPHVHEHAHGEAHDHAAAHEHPHAERLGRTPRAAYGIGLVHGMGGSAGVGIVLVGAVSGTVAATVALALFAVATAVSMALASTAFGAALSRGPASRRLESLAPAFGALSLLFGVWYALGAAGTVPYVL